MRTRLIHGLVLPALTALTFAGAFGAFLSMGATPAMALCKYGTPHCVNPNPGPKLPSVGGVQLPPSDWHDPECGYYGNCNTTSSASRSSNGINLGRANTVGKLYTH
jgi:hypothetical protein